MYTNKDENVHGFASSAIRGELFEREREREKERKRETERWRDRERQRERETDRQTKMGQKSISKMRQSP